MNGESTRKRAEEGDSEAQCSMALLYELGLNGKADLQEAAKWWKMAASQGSAWAARKLQQLSRKKQISLTAEESSKFFKLAVSENQANLAEFSSYSDPNLSNLKKVLVIDDNPEILKQAVDLLSKENFRVLTALSAREALKCIGEHPNISAILIDQYMPGLSGFGFLSILRKQQILEGVPTILIITETPDLEALSKSERLRVDQWVTKPFISGVFVNLVKKTISEASKNGSKPQQ